MTRLHGGLPERLARAGVTEREAEVLSAVAERLHNREIADRLHLSVRTVVADAWRGSANRSRRPPPPPDEGLRRSLARRLGRPAFDDAHDQGRSLSPTEALQLTSTPPAQPARHASSW